MDDIFSTNIDLETDSQPPKMTKDEFIAKAKKLLAKIDMKYSQHWKDKPDDNEEAVCSRCGGFTQIEQGGDIVDCHMCKGTGEAQGERVFDSEGFLEVIEHEIMFGSEPFFELINCEIVDTKTDSSACW
ncbi:MAG: hypothetical protein IPM42_22085 [Saprospiraceae bacterium]|nr:hypothetical protein [Saprospiraceae bacterium]